MFFFSQLLLGKKNSAQNSEENRRVNIAPLIFLENYLDLIVVTPWLLKRVGEYFRQSYFCSCCEYFWT